jgi:glycerophosphoryl diester phosphodiesterase
MLLWTRHYCVSRILIRAFCALFFSAAIHPAGAAGKPEVIAHRGGAALRPENTIAAFQHALKLGVDVLEFDMNVTADGHVVLHHDSTVNPEICRPSPGSKVQPSPIGTLTLADIRQFDCGSFQRPDSPHHQSVPGQPLPTLDEFLVSVKGSRLLLLGETKMPPAGSAYAVSPDRFADLIHTALKRHKVEDRFILQSSDYRTLDAMRKKNPNIRICLLNARQFKPAYLDVARRHRATHLMLRAEDVDSEQVRQLQSAGLQVFSGTANSVAEWKKYVELGVDAILTDDPRGLIDFLGR